jgi:integrase
VSWRQSAALASQTTVASEPKLERLTRSLRQAQKRGSNDPRPTSENDVVARRSHGTGSLSIRRDARGRETWYGQWWSGGGHANRKIGLKRQPGGREGLTRVQAERELRRRMDQDAAVLARGQRRSVAAAGEEYVDHLEHVMERKATTVKDYRGYLRRHLAPFFGERTLDGIDEREVGSYLMRKRGERLSAKTVNNHLNFLHGLFKFAVKRGWAERNPVALVDRPKAHHPRQRRIRFLQPVELDAVIQSVPHDELGSVESPLYLAAAMTGMRQGELIALSWQDVDWLAGRIRIVDNFPRGRVDAADSPKSHHGRSVPMADRLAAELELHFQRTAFRGDTDLVFCHPHTGHPLDPSKLRKRFGEALARAHVRAVTFHELRHTFGTQMAAAGAPLRAIQEWMGHADAKTTEIYSHYAPDPSQGAVFAERAFGTPRFNPRYKESETAGTSAT